MSYYFTHTETLEEGLRRIGREQTEKALGDLQDDEMSLEDRVHQTRKHGKKIRALLRIVRPGMEDVYKEENANIRDACKLLAPLRDAHAMQANLSRLVDDEAEVFHCDALQNFAEALDDFTRRQEREAADEDLIKRAVCMFEETLGRIEDWQLEDSPEKALYKGIKKTYKRGRKAMDDAYDDPSTETFHEWRKRVKYHRYHIRLLKHSWKPLLNPLRKELHVVSNFLGEEHDIAVLLDHLEVVEKEGFDENMAQHCRTYLSERQEQLRTGIRPLGLRVFCEKPKALASRMGGYYQIWTS